MPAAAGSSKPIPRVTAWRLLALLLCLPSLHPWAKDPENLYMLECQGCHLSDGGGGLENIPTLQGNVANFPTVAGGREYLVQVPGVALSTLSDRELSEVLNWMLRTFGPAESTQLYPPYTAEEVARLRRQPLTEVTETRAALLLLMTPSAAHPAR